MISFTQAELPALPGDIAFAITSCNGGDLTDEGYRSRVSTNLFEQLAGMLGETGRGISVQKEGSGRPVVHAGNEKWGASITHSRGFIACAINRSGEIGIDLESADRKEHPALKNRVTSAGDNSRILNEFSTIRLWTIKEAVLKMQGSGLRTAMKNVALQPISTNLVSAEVDSIRAIVYSCTIDRFWVALSWPDQ